MSLFGTSGIRAVVDSWLIQLALKVGLVVGMGKNNVVVGCDTRTSSGAMKGAVIAGLLAAGSSCYDAGVVPTPTLALAAKEFNAGVMITASHNPPQYNGIKLLNPDGSAFNKKQQESIEEIISDNSINTAPWQKFQSLKNYPDAVRKHIDSILTFFPDKYKLKVVLDCDCGAGSVITPELLKMMGCEVIELNCEPSGYFPHDIEPTEKNLTNLMEAVRESGADLGIAHDGDADRMMSIDDRGRFIGGDKLLVIMARELGAKKVITTIDASMAIEEAGFEVIHTSVGDNYISQELKRGGDIGGEPSGSWIIPRNSLCPDGIYAAAMLVSITSKKRLSSLVDDIPGYSLIRGNIGSNGVAMTRLEGDLVKTIQPLSVNKVDGLKLNIEDGWVLVRASGTEPKIRITVEAKTEERAKYLYNKSLELINKSASINGEG